MVTIGSMEFTEAIWGNWGPFVRHYDGDVVMALSGCVYYDAGRVRPIKVIRRWASHSLTNLIKYSAFLMNFVPGYSDYQIQYGNG